MEKLGDSQCMLLLQLKEPQSLSIIKRIVCTMDKLCNYFVDRSELIIYA